MSEDEAAAAVEKAALKAFEEPEEKVRYDLLCLGRHIGTFSGWDAVSEDCQVFYDFQPVSNFPYPAGDISIDYSKGVIYTARDEDGEEENVQDLIPLISPLEKWVAPSEEDEENDLDGTTDENGE